MAGEYDKSKYTRKQRLQNFWYYNRMYIIIGVVSVLFLAVQFSKVINQTAVGFHGVFFNTICASLDDGVSYVDGFGESLGVDTKRYVMESDMYNDFDLTDEIDEIEYATIQRLSAYVANGDLDTVIADESAFNFISYWDALADLRDIYTPEQLEELKPYLYYIDKKVADARAEAMYGTEEYESISLPDPKDPDAMEEPIPVGIYLDNQSESFREEFDIANGVGVVGIFLTTQRAGVCRSFISYIMG